MYNTYEENHNKDRNSEKLFILRDVHLFEHDHGTFASVIEKDSDDIEFQTRLLGEVFF
jgi:hypothetical protein